MNPRAYTYMDTHQHRLESVDPLKYVVTDPEIRNWPVLHAGSEHAGGRDVRVLVPEGSVYLQPNETRMFDTGLAAWIEAPGYVGLLFARSGTGTKGLVLGNGTGVIDADYQGSLKVCLWNRSDAPFLVTSGDRVAQLVIVPCVTGYKIEEVTSFEESTARGSDGFGSSGRQ